MKIYNPPPPAEEVLLKLADLTAYLTGTHITIDIDGPGGDHLHAEFDRRQKPGSGKDEN